MRDISILPDKRGHSVQKVMPPRGDATGAVSKISGMSHKTKGSRIWSHVEQRRRGFGHQLLRREHRLHMRQLDLTHLATAMLARTTSVVVYKML